MPEPMRKSGFVIILLFLSSVGSVEGSENGQPAVEGECWKRRNASDEELLEERE